ncbi:MAG TPA: hypothetical protein VLM44_10930, partial [Lutibacter sp.]|nr:hypothetical protein [Lutibacter sp.]
MKNIKYILTFLSLALIFSSCEEENQEFGDIITPTNVQITAVLAGADANNPFGDGSGIVTFKVNADNAITYKFVYEGTEIVAASGSKTYTFGTTGTNKYNVTAIAVGTAGASSSTTMEVEVLVLYAPPADLLTML